jgi:mannose-1-phosphate guanylyltransferase / mannose-6-phosphate isomerase
LIPVILSGGSGTRLWPLSRAQHPKQFLPLTTEYSLLQDTVLRLAGVSDMRPPVMVCNEDHRFLVAEQLREIDCVPGNILLEPAARNTAPAVALAALSAQAEDILLILPADHVITDIEAFHTALAAAKGLASEGSLVTFGVVPDHAATGYGYIRGSKANGPGAGAMAIEQFIEKPDLTTAQGYIDEGNYYWNSGMFAFRADTYLAELGKWRPDILLACEEAMKISARDFDFIRVDSEAFTSCSSESIDYAVMEPTDKGVVIPLKAGWSDVGSWSALLDIASHDERGNVVKGDVIAVNTRNSYLHAQSKLVATLGVEDLIVVDTDDAVLVAHRNQVQDVKEIVNLLKENNRSEADQQRKVSRPWGYYESIAQDHRYQVKRIVVNPGARLSLQKHQHRCEHWVVVQGTALVTRDQEKLVLETDQSTYIPAGMIHCLENKTTELLEIIEVQTGDYLGEDDIVRLEDNYGRAD